MRRALSLESHCCCSILHYTGRDCSPGKYTFVLGTNYNSRLEPLSGQSPKRDCSPKTVERTVSVSSESVFGEKVYIESSLASLEASYGGDCRQNKSYDITGLAWLRVY